MGSLGQGADGLLHASCTHQSLAALYVLEVDLYSLASTCSKNVTFGAGDVLELVALLEAGTAAPLAVGSSGAGGAVVRPSRWVQGLGSSGARPFLIIAYARSAPAVPPGLSSAARVREQGAPAHLTRNSAFFAGCGRCWRPAPAAPPS